jgi:hypothetical protein
MDPADEKASGLTGRAVASIPADASTNNLTSGDFGCKHDIDQGSTRTRVGSPVHGILVGVDRIFIQSLNQRQ